MTEPIMTEPTPEQVAVWRVAATYHASRVNDMPMNHEARVLALADALTATRARLTEVERDRGAWGGEADELRCSMSDDDRNWYDMYFSAKSRAEKDEAELSSLRDLYTALASQHSQAANDLAALRAGVEALADEWETAHGDPPVDPSHISVRHATRLRALLDGDGGE